MSSALVQLEIALHNEECKEEVCPGHEDKYLNLAKAAISVFPPENEPWWLRDRKLVQETSLDLIIKRLDSIDGKLPNAS